MVPTRRSLALYVIAAWAAAGCVHIAGDLVTTEAGRVRSPSGGLEAVVMRTDGGATTEYTDWDVYVQRVHWPDWTRTQVAHFQGGGVAPHWTGANDLTLDYGFAQESQLMQRAVKFWGDSVRVTMHPGPESS
jgi:hypothetical protein